MIKLNFHHLFVIYFFIRVANYTGISIFFNEKK